MRVYTVQCREPKTGQQKVQLYCKDEIHCRSGYSLSMTVVKGQKKISFLTDRWWFGKKNSLLLKTVVMRQKKISLLIDCRDVAKQSFFYDFRLSFSWYKNTVYIGLCGCWQKLVFSEQTEIPILWEYYTYQNNGSRT